MLRATALGMAEALTAFSRGRNVSVEFVTGVMVRGRVQNVDRQAGIAILEEIPTAKMIVVSLSAVAKVTVIATQPTQWPEKLPLASPPLKAANALRSAAAAYAKLPPSSAGVDGEQVYNALAKTMACRWENDGSILVLGGIVRVSPPYRVANISR